MNDATTSRPSDPRGLADLATRLRLSLLDRGAAEGLEVEYVVNWGGFERASFRVRHGSRHAHVKLADDPDGIAGLRRWQAHASYLSDRYHAPRMIDWVAIPGTDFQGPVLEWVEGAVPTHRDPRLVAEVGEILGRLHADRALRDAFEAGAPPRSFSDLYLAGLHRRFEEDLFVVSRSPPPFVRTEDLAWMRREARALGSRVRGSRAFRARASDATHGDLWTDNLVRARDGSLFVLDWDGLDLGDPALDWAVFLGPLRTDLAPADARALPAALAEDEAFLERFLVFRRAGLLDWVVDGLADWIEAGTLGPEAEVLRGEKEAVYARALAAYREAF